MKLKRELTILILGEWDFAGCGFFLSQAINHTTDNVASCVRIHQSTLGFPFEYQAISDELLADLWKLADVIHIHDDYRNLPAGLQKKPTVITYHGSLYRATPSDYDNKARAEGWLQTVATVDLTALGPRWLPDTRPDISAYIDKSSVFKVCHAPTKRKVKGTSEVLQACRKTTDLDLIENTQWNEALRRKGTCWATVDQFQLGYGCNAIEAWMMGQPVIGGATDPMVLWKIETTAGFQPLVVADGSVDQIRDRIERLRDDKEFYQQAAERGQKYAERFHSPKAVANQAVRYYHEAIEAFYSRGTNYASIRQEDTPRRGLRGAALPRLTVEVEYLGKSIGWVTFDAGRNKYRFNTSNPIQPVLIADLPALLAIRDTPRRERGQKARKPGQLLFRRL